MTAAAITPKVWTHMLAEGGRWSAAELGEFARVERKQIENLLFSAVNKGYVVRFDDASRANGSAYGVTAACRIPQGVHLNEILKAVGTPA